MTFDSLEGDTWHYPLRGFGVILNYRELDQNRVSYRPHDGHIKKQSGLSPANRVDVASGSIPSYPGHIMVDYQRRKGGNCRWQIYLIGILPLVFSFILFNNTLPY
jgi:hypothetical protein